MAEQLQIVFRLHQSGLRIEARYPSRNLPTRVLERDQTCVERINALRKTYRVYAAKRSFVPDTDVALITQLQHFGGQLYELFFGGLEDALRDVRSLLLVHDTYWLPLELAHDGSTFLGLRYAMGNWVREFGALGETTRISQRASLRAVCIGAEEERVWQSLQRNADCLRLRHTRASSLLDRLASQDCQVYHFACHGNWDPENPSSAFLLLDQDRSLADESAFLSAKALASARLPKALVFINACHSGSISEGQAGFLGFADSVFRAGAAAFLTTLWSVTETGATQFAADLYARLSVGSPVGEAVRAAREHGWATGGSPLTALAYVLLGDPSQSLVCPDVRETERDTRQERTAGPEAMGRTTRAVSDRSMPLLASRDLQPEPVQLPKVFVSYSHKDTRWKDALVSNLMVLQKAGRLDVWDDRQIGIGDAWLDEIRGAIDDASVAILLVSSGFLTSEFVLEKEMPRLAERRQRGQLTILPVIVEPCPWEKVGWLASMQVWPVGGKALSRMSRTKAAEELVQVTLRVADLLEHRLATAGGSIYDHLRDYRSRQQTDVLRQSSFRRQLLQWDLFALPILCRKDTLERLPAGKVRVEQLLQENSRLLSLVGSPGCGKTTACGRFRANAPEPLVPVDISDRIPCATEDIVDYVADEARLAGRRAFRDCERDGRFLFIIDGLGEQRHLSRTAECVNALARDFSRSRFVVTCRTGEFVPSLFDSFQRWNILELDDETQNEFLAQQPEELQRRAMRVFEKNPQLRTICTRQFLFILLLELVADDETNPPVPTRAGLYESFLDRFLRRWENRRTGDRVLILQTLEEVAVAMRKHGEKRTRLATEPIRAVIHRILRRVDRQPPDEDVQETFDDLLRLGLLELRHDGLAFFQETFQEFLCAKWLNELCTTPEDFSDRDGERWFRGDLQVDAEVWSFYLELKATAEAR